MAIVHVGSSSESASRGGGGVAGGDDRSSSPSSVSSSYLERSEWEGGSEPQRPVHSGEWSDLGPQSLVYSGERVINGVAIDLLMGGVEIDDDEEMLVDGWPTVRGYEWASHDVGLYVSEYNTKAKFQWWVDQSHIVRDAEDSRLIRLGVSRLNEPIFHR
ncbi:hypothetical protein LR48_Vigan272s003000 [Vigna angularis]|uniref:Uncharacterized protein n=1 Tax=Phaseolus angularis TaxID=3914 RepID=A0A0L9T793_PHAAN|nr:hypothetical protein LR48_Vigan272s003000 [Vigna angularis]